MSKAEVSVGLYQEITTKETLSNLHKNGYDLMVIAVAVINPLNSSTVDNEINLKCNEHAAILMQSARHHIITLISGNLECDSICESVRHSSENELLQQLSFADHFDTPSMIPLKYIDNHNLARIISGRKNKSTYF